MSYVRVPSFAGALGVVMIDPCDTQAKQYAAAVAERDGLSPNEHFQLYRDYKHRVCEGGEPPPSMPIVKPGPPPPPKPASPAPVLNGLVGATPVCPTAGDAFVDRGQFFSSNPELAAATYGECGPKGPTNWKCPAGYEANSISLTARSGEKWHGALCKPAADPVAAQPTEQTQPVVTTAAAEQAEFKTNGTRKLLIVAAIVGGGYLLWRMAK